jgi:hypothetical protein
MPHWVTWPGISVGFCLILWGVLPNHQKIPIGLVILFIACVAGIAGSAAWYEIVQQYNIKTKNQTPSKLTLSLKKLSIVDIKGKLSMELLFHNDGGEQYAIERVGIYFPPNDILSNLTENDTIDNNYNNKPVIRFIDNQLNAVGRGCKLPPDFPKVLTPGQLYPLKLEIPFVVSQYYKEQHLVNIKRLVVGIQVIMLDYTGNSHELIIPPIAQIDIVNDSEIKGLAYKSPTTFNIEIENNHIMPAQVKGLRVKSVVLTPTPGVGVVIPPPPANADEVDFFIK